MRTAARVTAVAGAAMLALSGACTGGGAQPADGPASPMADCAALATPPAGAEPQAAAKRQTGQSTPLPELTLPCFTGEEPFALADLRGPAVVNLWATWCEPCIEELPALQRLAERAADQVHVLGVVTADTRTRAAALATDLDLTIPALYDREERVLTALVLTAPVRAALPVTVFIDAQGRIAHVYQAAPFDDTRLAGLVEEHLGVAVESG